MSGPVLLDTHCWVWSLFDTARLPSTATMALSDADAVYVSVISLFEIGQKVRVGKWPEMERFLPRLTELADRQGARLLEISARSSLLAATLDWVHRDPFDRIIGASAITMGMPLISADTAFDALATIRGWPGRIW